MPQRAPQALFDISRKVPIPDHRSPDTAQWAVSGEPVLTTGFPQIQPRFPRAAPTHVHRPYLHENEPAEMWRPHAKCPTPHVPDRRNVSPPYSPPYSRACSMYQFVGSGKVAGK